jgi:hypothetical protein
MRVFCSLLFASVSMSLTCSLYAQSATSHQSDELVPCSQCLERATHETNDASCLGGCDRCGTDCGCSDACRPLWSVSAGTVILHRSTPQPSPLARTWNRTATLLDADSFKFGWDAGPDIRVTRRVDKCAAFDAIEFRYFDVQGAQGNASTLTNGFWRLPIGPGLIHNSQIDASYNSQLHSAELNVLRDSSCSRLTWLAGFRWIGLDEQLNMAVQLIPQGTISHYTHATQNNLYGGQIGAALKLCDNRGPFHIDCVSKAGLFSNTAANRYDSADSFGNHAFLASDRRSQVAFVGDIGLTGVYQWTDHVAFQAGYQLLWIQGVAVAGDQAAVADPATHVGIQSAGGVFYHGATASVNFSW